MPMYMYTLVLLPHSLLLPSSFLPPSLLPSILLFLAPFLPPPFLSSSHPPALFSLLTQVQCIQLYHFILHFIHYLTGTYTGAEA